MQAHRWQTQAMAGAAVLAATTLAFLRLCLGNAALFPLVGSVAPLAREANVACALMAVLVLYALAGMRGFSFDETIAGITPLAPLRQPETSEERLARVCGRLGRDAGLTPRETEVLALLARGRNNAFIQEELSLTRNTVKTYVKRIYAKLDVHSQQEVIDLAEEER